MCPTRSHRLKSLRFREAGSNSPPFKRTARAAETLPFGWIQGFLVQQESNTVSQVRPYLSYQDGEIAMRHGYEFVGPILNAARKGGAEGRTLADILREVSPFTDGRIPSDTVAALLGHALIGLVSHKLVRINAPSSNDLSKKIVSLRGGGFEGGYAAAEALRQQGEKNVVISISPDFSDLQELIGFSVTDMLEAAKGSTIRVRPFFGEPDQDATLKSDVFVLMPFKPELRPVYDDHIKTACNNAVLSCRRADDFFRVGQIMNDIWAAISLADWIIADCTGRNANVFYEMGIAHTLGKRVILITQDEDDVPFDIRHIRFFKYEFTPRGMKKLEEVLVSTLKTQD
jgi:hypothetical protein